MKEKIEKELLTDEEIFEVMYGTTWAEFQKQIPNDGAQKIETYIGGSDFEKVAQAQLDKVLKVIGE